MPSSMVKNGSVLPPYRNKSSITRRQYRDVGIGFRTGAQHEAMKPLIMKIYFLSRLIDGMQSIIGKEAALSAR